MVTICRGTASRLVTAVAAIASGGATMAPSAKAADHEMPGTRACAAVATAHAETTTRHGLPVTTVARTLQDLAATRPEAEVRKALNQALVHHLVTIDGMGHPDEVFRRMIHAIDTRRLIRR